MLGQTGIGLSILIVILQNLFVLVGLVVGAALVPLLALVGPPPIIGEPLARLTSRVAQMVRGPSVLQKQADGQYQMRRPEELTDGDVATDGGSAAPGGLGPKANWTRFRGVPLALDYERVEGAWGDVAERISPNGDYAVPPVETLSEIELPGRRLPTAVERGTVRHFFDAGEGSEDGFLVTLYAAGERMQDAAGIEMANRAMGRAMEDFGGDSGGYSGLTMLAGTIVMFLLGAGLGVVVVL